MALQKRAVLDDPAFKQALLDAVAKVTGAQKPRSARHPVQNPPQKPPQQEAVFPRNPKDPVPTILTVRNINL